MSNKLDKPLEDIIKEEKSSKRNRGNKRGRGQRRGQSRGEFRNQGGRYARNNNFNRRKFSGDRDGQRRRGLPRKYVAPRKAVNNPNRPKKQLNKQPTKVYNTRSQFIRKSGYRKPDPAPKLNKSFEEKRKRVLKVSGLHFDLSNNDLFVSFKNGSECEMLPKV